MDEARSITPALGARLRSRFLKSRVAWVSALALAAGLTAQAAPANAYTGAPLWTCRGSALYASVNGNNRVEPVVANGNPNTANGVTSDRAQCVDAEEGANNLATPLGISPTALTAKTAAAVTTIVPELGPSITQTATATGGVENLGLGLPGSGNIAGAALGLGVANATATASCVNGAPSLRGSSKVTNITLGGQSVSLDNLLTALSNALKPLNILVSLAINEQITNPANHTLTVNALHLKLFNGNPNVPFLDLIVGQARVGYTGDVCNPHVGPPVCLNSPVQPTDNSAATEEEIEAQCGVEEPDGPGQVNTNGYVVMNVNGVPTRVPVNCAHIKMRWQDNKKTTLTALYFKQRLVTRGVLTSCSQNQTVGTTVVHVPAGRPVINAKIDVIHIFGGRRVPQKTGMKSRGHGRLTLILPRNITTRTIEYTYRGNLNSSHVNSRAILHLKVRTASGRLVTGAAKGPQF